MKFGRRGVSFAHSKGKSTDSKQIFEGQNRWENNVDTQIYPPSAEIVSRAEETQQLPVANLCSNCEKIIIQSLESEEGFLHSADILDLEKTAPHCDICDRLKRALIANACRLAPGTSILDLTEAMKGIRNQRKRENGPDIPETCPVLLGLFSGGIFRPKRIHVGVRFRDDPLDIPLQERCRTMDLTLGSIFLHGEGEPTPLIPRKEGLPLFDWIIGRLLPQSPLDDHIVTKEALPTHILDLGETACWDSDIKLTLGRKRLEHYVTLSHCWGSYQGLTTEKQSYLKRCDCISFYELPLLFQQAVHVTRGLRYRYLWIDALCVIQDSKDDWEREALQMAQIFRGCTVRIAVTAARDSSQAFLLPCQSSKL